MNTDYAIGLLAVMISLPGVAMLIWALMSRQFRRNNPVEYVVLDEDDQPRRRELYEPVKSRAHRPLESPSAPIQRRHWRFWLPLGIVFVSLALGPIVTVGYILTHGK